MTTTSILFLIPLLYFTVGLRDYCELRMSSKSIDDNFLLYHSIQTILMLDNFNFPLCID